MYTKNANGALLFFLVVGGVVVIVQVKENPCLDLPVCQGVGLL